MSRCHPQNHLVHPARHHHRSHQSLHQCPDRSLLRPLRTRPRPLACIIGFIATFCTATHDTAAAAANTFPAIAATTQLPASKTEIAALTGGLVIRCQDSRRRRSHFHRHMRFQGHSGCHHRKARKHYR